MSDLTKMLLKEQFGGFLTKLLNPVESFARRAEAVIADIILNRMDYECHSSSCVCERRGRTDLQRDV